MIGWLVSFAWADAPRGVDTPWGPSHEVVVDVSEGTWMSVTVSGDTVVFDLLGDLWSLPLSGGEARRLTSGLAWDSDPAFSPDGAWIAFSSDRGGNRNLWVMRSDGSEARAVTAELVARVHEPTWDPTSGWLIGRRRTVDTRSTGVFELWTWPVDLRGPATEDPPTGVPLTRLADHPHAGEAWPIGEETLLFSSRAGRFDYDANPMASLWQILALDRPTGEIRPVVSGSGSAARPVASEDGSVIWFVSRERERTWLERFEPATGDRRVIADWLDHDQMEGNAIHGTYPRVSRTPDGDLVLWASGRLWRVDGDTGARSEIPFRVRGAWTVHDVKHVTNDIHDDVHGRLVRWGSWSDDGDAAFSAMGRLWVRRAGGALEAASGAATGYAPAWSAEGALAWTTWSDQEGGRLIVRDGRREETLPVQGLLTAPAWNGDGTELVVLRASTAAPRVDLAGIDAWEVVILTRTKRGWTDTIVTRTANLGASRPAQAPTLWGDRVWLPKDRDGGERQPNDVSWVSVARDGTDERVHALLGGAEWVTPSPNHEFIAWVEDHSVWVAALPPHPRSVDLTGDAVPKVKLTDRVGRWVGWTPSGDAVTWIEGDTLVRLPVEGIGAADPAPERIAAGVDVPRARPEGRLAIVNARVVTMAGDEVLEGATVLVEGDRIAAVGREVVVPPGTQVLDGAGRTVFPGLIDVHAHLHYTAGDVLPEQEWRYRVALAYGVTTVHDPSASTDTVFTQAERVEAGFELGPRVYSTGSILYGALSNEAADTPDLEAARVHVARASSYGARSVKVYQQSQRERRQWYAQVCAESGVSCVLEGGSDLWMDLTAAVDGFQVLEHSLPVAPLYADVRSLLAGVASAAGPGPFYTPTLLVAYGGLPGQHQFWQEDNPIDDPRMRAYWPPRELSAIAFRRPVGAADRVWNHEQVAREAAALGRLGVPITLGAHGTLQGLGVHWELWALASDGAMTPHEALRAATWNGARYLGLEGSLGAVTAGRLADLVVVEGDPLVDLRQSDDIVWVIKNGVLVP